MGFWSRSIAINPAIALPANCPASCLMSSQRACRGLAWGETISTDFLVRNSTSELWEPAFVLASSSVHALTRRSPALQITDPPVFIPERCVVKSPTLILPVMQAGRNLRSERKESMSWRRRRTRAAGAALAGALLLSSCTRHSKASMNYERAPEGWEVLDATAGHDGWARKVKDPRTDITFILVEPGTFQMGSPETESDRDTDEGPLHEVRITNAFYLAETEVTQAQWLRLMEHAKDFLPDDSPVENVSYIDAERFCTKAGYQLPTEAQWEYACRAGTNTPWSTGTSLTTQQANISRKGNAYDGQNQTKPVRSYAANQWGFYDMHGNVWEWCKDMYDARFYSRSTVEDPKCTSVTSGCAHHVILVAIEGETSGRSQPLRTSRKPSCTSARGMTARSMIA